MFKHKILITSPSLNTEKNIGGISNLTRLLIDNNKEVDYTHFVVGKEDTQERNHKWFISQFRKWVDFHKTLRKEKIEVVHINIPLGKFSIIINYTLIIIATLNRKKIVVHLRGGKLSLNNNIKFFQKFIIKHSLKLADTVILLGEKERNFTASYYKISQAKLQVLPNAVVVPKEELINNKISTRSGEEDIINILFIGRIDQNKGLNEIVEAFEDIKKKYFSFRFILAGTGPDKKWFIERCKKTLGEKFQYMGVVDYLEKQKLFMETDIFILPSYFEGLPNGLLEAMAYGAVPICTPVGAIPEVVFNTNNGLLIEKNNYKQLAHSINTLLGNSKLRYNLGKEAYKTVKDNFSLVTYIKKLNNVYNELI
ncbi:glycosyltransferase family 4 protein [Petrimonas mucosa]|uniref:Putative glycosyltransferase MJ1607 n=1 Tax=Petrimonas mucosa TaxID=1642646 RepID=A0A1G4GAP8_9BACT|nr:glycosyltransferase family 4 protein [Petrimonas mucosa]SCM59626.1 putative glycosyltransferase MJ1607 [Petrimonas mucosa]